MFAIILFCLFLLAAGVAAVGATPDPPATYQGATAQQWARKFRHMRHLAYTRRIHNRQLRRVLLHRPNVTEAIELAATVYGHRAELWRKARCESNLNPRARNGSEASGLFQFLPSTWRSTPLRRFSVFSPYANALAAGWMHAHNRGSEWTCL